jgi:uncharacterized DUF497 family protein
MYTRRGSKYRIISARRARKNEEAAYGFYFNEAALPMPS